VGPRAGLDAEARRKIPCEETVGINKIFSDCKPCKLKITDVSETSSVLIIRAVVSS
jgi:hypothetical protein